MISLIGPPGSGKTTVGIALAQRLGGDGTAIHAGTAQAAIALDERHAPPRLRRLYRGLLPRRAAADNE